MNNNDRKKTLFVLCEKWFPKNSRHCFEDYRDDCEKFEPSYYLSLDKAKEAQKNLENAFIYEAVFDIPTYETLLQLCLESWMLSETSFYDYLTQNVTIINRIDPDEK